MLPSHRSGEKIALLFGLIGALLGWILVTTRPSDRMVVWWRMVPEPPVSSTAGDLAIAFTNPGQTGFHGGPEEALIEALDAARAAVDLAAYDIDLWEMRDALIRAHRRGVTVRVVVEADQRDGPEIQALVEAGIPLVFDRLDGLMHNKFVIIDRSEVWTGSMNFTLNGAYRNNNHLVRIVSTEVAEIYRLEFDEMFIDRIFGAYSSPGLPGLVEITGMSGEKVPIEVYFSPDDGARDRILELLGSATRSIRFMAFSFTSSEIVDGILARAREGVQVEGVLDASQLKASGEAVYERMVAAGIDVRVGTGPGKLHHKVIVIDEALVFFGSYNFSESAETRNDENLVILHDPAAAALFLEEWQRLFEAGR